MHNQVLQKRRRALRRQRRLAIEERRRRRELQNDEPLIKKVESACMNIDGSKYCRDGGDPTKERRLQEIEKRRELHEYMEERGVSMVVPALSNSHGPEGGGNKKMRARDVHNRRLHV